MLHYHQGIIATVFDDDDDDDAIDTDLLKLNLPKAVLDICRLQLHSFPR